MRFMLIVLLCSAACTKSEEKVSELDSKQPAPPAGPRATAPVEVAMLEVEGWVGPYNDLAASWEGRFQNCMRVHTTLPADVYEQAPSTDQVLLTDLHRLILTRWERDKTIVETSCEEAYATRPILARCDFDAPFNLVRQQDVKRDDLKAFLNKYLERGRLSFGYKYYNPENAVDDPTFKRQCLAAKGTWDAVDADSPEYAEATRQYAAEADEKKGKADEPKAD